jgi:trans-feruloyl-CoA hydratase/vanillin synthase
VPNDERATDYIAAKAAQLAGRDPERGRKEGLSQFLDTKEYQPGLGAYRRDVP